VRRLLRIPLRSAVVAVGTSATLFTGSLILFLILGTPERRVVSVFANTQDPKQVGELKSYLEHHGATRCEPYVRKADKTELYFSTTRATAAVSCDAIGTGADHLRAYRFSKPSDLTAWETEQVGFIGSTGSYGVCDSEGGRSPWTNEDGVISGELICESTSDGNDNTIAWSDRPRRTGFFARADSSGVPALLSWWDKNVRGRRTTATAGDQAIRSTFARYLKGGMNGCHSEFDAMADAVVSCSSVVPRTKPKARLNQLTVYHFRRAPALDAFFENYAREFRAPRASSRTFCGIGSLVSSTYFNKGQLAGRVFCFPSNSSEFLLWTIDRRRLAGLISRSDQNAQKVYDAWQSLPG
jgi:hypothetical protein